MSKSLSSKQAERTRQERTRTHTPIFMHTVLLAGAEDDMFDYWLDISEWADRCFYTGIWMQLRKMADGRLIAIVTIMQYDDEADYLTDGVGSPGRRHPGVQQVFGTDRHYSEAWAKHEQIEIPFHLRTWELVDVWPRPEGLAGRMQEFFGDELDDELAASS